MPAGGCLRDGKVSDCDITHVGQDLVSGALILKGLNNRGSLWARMGKIDIGDKARENKSRKIDCHQC